MLFTYLCSSQYSDHDLVHAKKWKVCLLNHTVYKHMITSSILTMLVWEKGETVLNAENRQKVRLSFRFIHSSL
jgi:hypothetical protein